MELSLFNQQNQTGELNLRVFNCELGSIRVAMENGEPFFCAYDVCQALEYANGRDTLSRLFGDSVAKHYAILDTLGRAKQVSFLSEPQLYKLIMRSQAKKAEVFQEWVTGEVLPSIRKTGGYQAVPKTYAEALLEAGRLALENERLIAQAQADAPKLAVYDQLMECGENIDIRDYAKAAGVGFLKLYQKLRAEGLLMANNMPYQRYIKMGVFEVIERPYTDGSGRDRIQLKTLITPKGQAYITKRLKGAV